MSQLELRIQHLESLTSTSHQLLQDKLLTDVVIQCEEEKFPAHRFLLAAASSFFKEVFCNESFKDKKKVNIEGIKPHIFSIVLKFLYTGNISVDEEDVCLVMDILECSVVLRVPELYTFCLKLLLLHPSLDQILSLWDKIKEFGNNKTSQIYLEFMKSNLDLLKEKRSFLDISFNDLIIFLQIFNEAEVEHQDILKCFLLWLKDDFESRQEHISEIRKFVCFEKVNRSYLMHLLENEVCVRKCASLAMYLIDALQTQVQEKEMKSMSVAGETNYGDVDCESATSGGENLKVHESSPKTPLRKMKKTSSARQTADELPAKKRRSESQHHLPEFSPSEDITTINDLSPVTALKEVSTRKEKSVDDVQEIRKLVEQTPVQFLKDDSLHLAPKKISRSSQRLAECTITNKDSNLPLSPTEDISQTLETRQEQSSQNLTSLFVKEQIICIFGIDKGGTFCPVQKYLKCLQKNWIQKTEYPDEFMLYNSVCNYDNMLYFCGGRSTTDKLPSNSCWRFDLVSDKWQKMHPMLTRRCYAAVIELGDILYVLGGFSDKEPLKSVESYNPAYDTWQLLAPLPYPIANPVVVTVINRLCVIDKMRLLWYNPARNSWTSGIGLHNEILNIQTRAAASYDQVFVIPHHNPRYVYQIAVNSKDWKRWEIPNRILVDCWAILKNVNLNSWEFSVLSSKGIYLYNPPSTWELFDDTTHDLYYVRASILNLLQLRQ